MFLFLFLFLLLFLPSVLINLPWTLKKRTECGGSIDTLNFTFSGWGYWENRFAVPCVCRWHWLENKRMTHVCDRCEPRPQLLQCEVGCCAAAMRVTRVAGGLRTKLRMCKARCSTA